MSSIKDFFDEKLFVESNKESEYDSPDKSDNDNQMAFTPEICPLREPQEQRQESEKIKLWRERQSKILAEKDKQEAKTREEWIKSAKKELEAWHKQNRELVSNLQQNNRSPGKQDEETTDQVTSEHRWEKICSYCDFSPSLTESLHSKDRSRMLAVLLKMKTFAQ